jgi:hypothetical protein
LNLFQTTFKNCIAGKAKHCNNLNTSPRSAVHIMKGKDDTLEDMEIWLTVWMEDMD